MYLYSIYCSEAVSEPGNAPEDVGLTATRALLAEIEKDGCVQQRHQTLVLLLMVLGSEDVGRSVMGQIMVRHEYNMSRLQKPMFKFHASNTSAGTLEELLWP